MTTTTQPKPTLTPAGVKALDEFLAGIAAEQKLPATYLGVANADGPLYFAAAGNRVYGQPDKGQVNENTPVQLFSMTKLATAVSCIQLLEQGLVSLDDPQLIATHLPELLRQPILTGWDDAGAPLTTPRKNPITLRNLLTHTNGSGYGFLNPDIGKWEVYSGKPNWLSQGAGVEALEQPLTFEPGTAFQYSIGIDWAGVLVERLTGKTLHDYMVDNVFAPIGITGIGFYPDDAFKQTHQLMSAAVPDTDMIVPHPGMRDIATWTKDDVKLRLGGAGLLGTLKDYLAFITEILRCQVRDGIIKTTSWDLLFTDQFPKVDGPSPFAPGLGALNTLLGSDVAQWNDGSGIVWSLGLNVTLVDSPHGRKAGSGMWEGVAKTKYWIDPKTGITAVMGTQLMDLQPGEFMRLFPKFEEIVYANLQHA